MFNENARVAKTTEYRLQLLLVSVSVYPAYFFRLGVVPKEYLWGLPLQVFTGRVL